MRIFLSLCACLIIYSSMKSQELTSFTPSFNLAGMSKVFEVENINKQNPFSCFSAYTMNPKYNGNISYRIHLNGKWSEWTTLKIYHDNPRDQRTVFIGEVILRSFDAVQFSTDILSQDQLVIRLFSHFESETKYPIDRSKSISCDPPQTCDRSCWCPSMNCPEDSTPFYTDPSHIIIHHSAGNTMSNDFGAVVSLYYDFHVNTNGWDDIGYNWLVDPDGVIYEGRGLDKLGAHFSCMNGNTIGICLIGDYTQTRPTDEALLGVEKICAWLASKYQLDVLSRNYHSSSELDLFSITSHRDGNPSPNGCSTTTCPGDSLYQFLGSIRQNVSDSECYKNAPDISVFRSTLEPENFVAGENVDWISYIENVGNLIGDSIYINYLINNKLVANDTILKLNPNVTNSLVFNHSLFTESIVYEFCISVDTLSNENITSNNSFCDSIDLRINNISTATNKDEECVVFPNPFRSSFVVSCRSVAQDHSSILFTYSGEKVAKILPHESNDLTHLDNGCYILKTLLPSGEFRIEKVVKF